LGDAFARAGFRPVGHLQGGRRGVRAPRRHFEPVPPLPGAAGTERIWRRIRALEPLFPGFFESGFIKSPEHGICAARDERPAGSAAEQRSISRPRRRRAHNRL